ncbi:MBL fold metallo-hydrolase [Ideonella sp.]|uniref:MBL fold metallo-hydrolase n=1 Tax=Ideonella sp. TaxID=1929293 RepID=UPI0035B1281E
MSFPTIVRVPILPFGMVNCHLIVGPAGCIVVDTGLPGSEHKIERALRSFGRTWADLRLIVVTHAHVDHAGSAARLRELSGAPILGHAADRDYFEQRRPMGFCETGWFGRLFMRTGLILEPYAPFTPDLLPSDAEPVDLRPFGIAGRALHTPGHTSGSISLDLDGGDALVGDLIASGILLGGLVRKGRAIRPPFEDDPRAVAVELRRLVDAGAQRFHMGHGGPLAASEVRRHAAKLSGMRAGQRLGGSAAS